MTRAAILALANGELFKGIAIGADGSSVGEVVFNTAMTGYQEILTDPSYASQIITFTHPHIGNTGVNEEDEESDRIWASGLVIRDLPLLASSWRKLSTLEDYLSSRKIVGIAQIDTRKLTRMLREQGSQNGCLMSGAVLGRAQEQQALSQARAFAGLKGMDLAKEVSVAQRYSWNQGSWSLTEGFKQPVEAKYHVVAYDFGSKRNILRLLVDRGCRLTVVPARTTAEEVIELQPDGVFLSNGPGDPDPCDYAIAAVRKILHTDIPIFGICLGFQILSLASGARTKKMKHGHHGANHPVKNLEDGTVLITSQNHGFCVDGESLPANMRVTHRSLFDGSLQGVCRTDKPAFGFQGHPEASPGPHDAAPLFDRFIELMEVYGATKEQSEQ